MKTKQDLNKPVRSDQHQLSKHFKAVTVLQGTLLGQFILILLLIVVNYSLSNKPVKYAVVDLSTGQAFSSKMVNQLNESIIEQQLVYYTKDFAEKFYDSDYMTIQKSREAALAVMTTSLQKSIPEDWTKGKEISQAQNNRATCQFKWIIKPIITNKDDPRFTVFGQFERTVTMQGYKPWTTKHYLRLDWGRLTEQFDPYERPHGLVLMNYTELAEESKGLIEQLNKLNTK